MNKVLLFFAFTLAAAYTSTAHGQQKSDDIIIRSDTVSVRLPEFCCKELIYNQQSGIMTLLGGVSLKTEKFELVNAGKVIYNELSKKLVIYDAEQLIFRGRIILKDAASKVKCIEYTLGDDDVYFL